MPTNTESPLFTYQTAVILVMSAGWGWIAGNFSAPFDTFWIGAVTNLGHCIPIALLVLFGLQFFRAQNARQHQVSHSNWGQVGITILAAVAIAACIVLVGLGASNPSPSAVGVKSPEDWFPTIILFLSASAWLVLQIPSLQRTVTAGIASNQ